MAASAVYSPRMSRAFGHWTPGYVFARSVVLWNEWRHPEEPWITREATLFLARWLRPTDQGLEWGTGRSTAWLAPRVDRLLAIEHDTAWHGRVAELLARQPKSNVDLRLIPTAGTAGSSEHPYVRAATSVAAHSLDFVLVDGVFREHCAEAALELLKPGGILILDNANWFLPHATRAPASVGAGGAPPNAVWARVWDRLRRLRRVWTSNRVTDTALFFAE